MNRTLRRVGLFAFLGVVGSCPMVDPATAMGAERDVPPLLKPTAAESAATAQRQKALAKEAPEGARLVAYLDCGTQRKSTTTDQVAITCPKGTPYRFPSEAKDALLTQPTVFYGPTEVAFQIDGIDRTRRYRVGLTWWDYDSGGRTQSVVVGSPDGRLVRLAVPGIGLPKYTDAGQLPATKRFALPATFARDGRMQLTVRHVTGANVVISELWIWQLE